MMDRYCSCCSFQGNMVGPCTCSGGPFYSRNTSFYDEHEADMYSSSFVDCTLSLGTPSTRLTKDDDVNDQKRTSKERRRSSFISSFFGKTKTSRGSIGSNNSGGEPLFARRCANCDTISTPLWRNGPKGPKSLCNACGIRYKKEERRATAASANGGAGAATTEPQHVMNSSWVYHHQSQTQQIPCYSSVYGNEYNYTQDDNDGNADTGGMSPFLSWHSRPGLVHNFTR